MQLHVAAESILAFVFGVVFLSIILVIAIFDPAPSPFSYTIYRIVIALAAAGVGAVIPGFLSVTFKNVLRAGGAVALFIVVYFFAPVALPPQPTSPVEIVTPGKSARLEAESWLSVVDRRDYSGAYDLMAGYFRERNTKADMISLFSQYLNPLGKVRERQLENAESAQNPPGAPPGVYQSYLYRTLFENDPRFVYEQVSLQGEASEWKVNGYHLALKNESGVFIPYQVYISPTAPK